MQAIKLFRRTKPEALIGFGGYPSFVPFMAAWVLRIPRILHEQNVKVGLANKVLAFFASEVYAVPDATGFIGNTMVTAAANPV